MDFILEFLRETGAGLVVWGLTILFPFRCMVVNTEFRWDVVAVFAVSVFSFFAASGLFITFDAVASHAGRWYDFISTWHVAALVLAYALVADLTSYWAHRLLHTKLLWHSHAFHHSPRHLYVLSGARASFVHIVVLFVGPVAGLVFFPVYEYPAVFAGVGWTQILNQHYIHSNLRFPFARQLEYLFVTPRFHFVHHSVNRGFSEKNFGFLLSVWDRLFGTYVAPETVPADAPMGLNYANSNLRLLVGLPPPR